MSPVDSKHTLSSFDTALAEIDRHILSMSEAVALQLGDIRRAIETADVGPAQTVILRDASIDADHDAIRAEAVAALMRFQPVAGDLRRIMGLQHAAIDLERIGDHAKSMAKRLIQGLHIDRKEPLLPAFLRLLDGAVRSVEQAADALLRRDPMLARQVIGGDNSLDKLYDDFFHMAVGSLRGGRRGEKVVHLLFAAKGLERIGDHATNIAEEVLFLASGEFPSARRSDAEPAAADGKGSA